MAEVLRDSVAKHMRADVTVGAFLSGGIDSTVVCGVAQGCSARPVQTFTVGFDGAGPDERPRATRAAPGQRFPTGIDAPGKRDHRCKCR